MIELRYDLINLRCKYEWKKSNVKKLQVLRSKLVDHWRRRLAGAPLAVISPILRRYYRRYQFTNQSVSQSIKQFNVVSTLSRESKVDGSQATVKGQFCDIGGEKRSQNHDDDQASRLRN